MEARINQAHASKTIAVWKYLMSTLLDPSQVHLQAAFWKIIVIDTDSKVQKMFESLKSNLPSLMLFDFGANPDDFGLVDVNLRNCVFLCSKLSSAVEQTSKILSSSKFDQ